MLVRIVPLVRTKKLTYVFPFIVLGHHALLQLIFSCTNVSIFQKRTPGVRRGVISKFESEV